jgi:hypothetical protein
VSLVVVGDALLDRDLTGTVDRLCPDAPVPSSTRPSTSLALVAPASRLCSPPRTGATSSS